MEKSFIKGMGDAAKRDQEGIKAEIMMQVGIANEVSWTQWLYGRLETRPSPAERIVIEQIFRNHGVEDPWGKE